MKSKILKTFFSILLILTLTMTKFVFLGYEVWAAYEELESQKIETNVKNVQFDAYFMNGNQKIHSKESDIYNKETLVLNVNVKDKGYLNDAKIKIENANFTILKNEVNNQYVKSINIDSNEIELNPIIYQNNAVIMLPISFKRQDNFEYDYFEKENAITITGNYLEEDNKNKEVSSTIKTRMIWKHVTDVSLNQNIDKYINLGNKILLQQNITTSLQDDKLPRENETIEVTVPIIDGQKPANVKVLLNGDKMQNDKALYNKEIGKVKINNETKEVLGVQNNVYKVIYEYENVEFTKKKIDLDIKMTTKLYTQNDIIKSDTKNIEIDAPIGNIVSLTKQTTNSKHKGYLYANSSNLTEYEELEKLEISNETEISNIDITENQENFLDNSGNQFDISSKTVYLETTFNKNNLINLLGENGAVTITDSNNNILSVINSQSVADEEGNIIVNYQTPARGVRISITKPVDIGTLLIKNKKALEGNTGYNKKQLKEFINLSSKTKVSTNISEEIVEAKINLLDTTTEAKLDINTASLSTLQKNENIQFTVTLKTDSENYDLYKNPVIEIVLPNCISNINVKSINKLYADEFGVKYARLVTKDNGEKIMQIALLGEQSDYSKEINEASIIINADIEFDMLTPSQKTNISMRYTNENGNEETYNTSVEVEIVSKPGMMIYNNLSGYNNAGDSLYTIDNNIPVGALDLGGNSNIATINTAIINNYDTDINNVVIIGRLPKKGTYNATVDTNLLQEINTNIEGVQVLYSSNLEATQEDNENSWTEDFTNASSYMIKIDTMAKGQVVKLSYKVVVPENIGYGQSMYTTIKTTYTYGGNTNTQTSTIGAKTEEVITNNILSLANTVTRQANNVGIAISTVSGGSELEDSQVVYEGQKIKYTMQITNNTGKDLSNINIKATQTNGNIYGLVEVQDYNPNTPNSEQTYHKYEELDTNEKIFDTIPILKSGESTVVYYETTTSEVEGNQQQTFGDIIITADGIEQINIRTIKNNISQAELKLTMESAYYEDEKVYLDRNIHMGLVIQNISGHTLNNVKGTIQLPEGAYCEDETDLIWSSIFVGNQLKEDPTSNLTNVSYDREKNILTFELSTIETGETTVLELYAQVNEFEEESKDFPIMYKMQSDNTYLSNIATNTIINTKRDVSIEQTASIDDNTKLKDEDIFDITLNVENNSQEELLFVVGDNVPEGFLVKSAKIIYSGNEENIPLYIEDSNQMDTYIDGNVILVQKMLEANTSMKIVITVEVEIENITEDTITNEAEVTYGEPAGDDKNYLYNWSNGVNSSKKFNIQSSEEAARWVEVKQEGEPQTNSTVKDGQQIKYTFTIKNLKEFEISTALYDYIPRGVVLETVLLDGNEQKIEEDVIIRGYKIPAGESATLEIIGHVDANEVKNNQILNNLMVSTNSGDFMSNDIVYTILQEEEPSNPGGETDNPDNPGETEDPDNPGSGNTGEYTISGIAWVDSNKDGRRDQTEETLSGITVRVMEVNSGKTLENANAKTGSDGYYEVKVPKGSYILVFGYDSSKYVLTEYKKIGVEDSQNSDVISKNITIDGINSKVGATDIINVTSDTQNIDIGLVQASTFDLQLDKYVSKATVQTNKGTTQYSYGNQKLARLEIHSKEINNATVIITYKIKITNTGELPGYVQNIIDYIPDDLRFSSELNPDWYKSSTNLQNNSLSNTVIAPGEDKTIELVLVKTMNENNTGTVINIAEIGQASNTQGINDVDSTPGNNNASEDDYSKAELIIGISTGGVVLFVLLTFVIFIILGIGIYFINKKVLRKNEEKI